ncbi:hypothetical protein TNCV_4543091 [Trichonephila clavipes]|nr:hypothetical protein TNCV_4543091 [Trichonephila clavipes]
MSQSPNLHEKYIRGELSLSDTKSKSQKYHGASTKERRRLCQNISRSSWKRGFCRNASAQNFDRSEEAEEQKSMVAKGDDWVWKET